MFSRASAKSAALLFVILSLVIVNISNLSYAFDFEPRSVVISTGVPSAVAEHDFSLTPARSDDIGSLVFEYCSNTPIIYVACIAPAGLDLSSASLISQSGNTGFSIDTVDSTVNKIVLSRTASPAIITASTYNFANITNPSTPGESVFVRIASFGSNDGSGAFIDKGAVAFAVQNTFIVNTYVPPFVRLCVGITVAPDCSSFIGDSIDLGILSSTHANFGNSQFATGTNDPSGYNVYALGTTMTSGNNIITALPAPTASIPGAQQFGINLRANLNPVTGQDPVGLGTGIPSPNYNIQNRFIFNDGDNIASSTLPSDYNRMTVSYLVNVPKSQIPGVYSTTITYLAVVQF